MLYENDNHVSPLMQLALGEKSICDSESFSETLILLNDVDWSSVKVERLFWIDRRSAKIIDISVVNNVYL